MTVKQTIKAIRALGLTCTRTTHGEYRINLLMSNGGTEDTAYYTDDADDALGTAQFMATVDADELTYRRATETIGDSCSASRLETE